MKTHTRLTDRCRSHLKNAMRIKFFSSLQTNLFQLCAFFVSLSSITIRRPSTSRTSLLGWQKIVSTKEKKRREKRRERKKTISALHFLHDKWWRVQSVVRVLSYMCNNHHRIRRSLKRATQSRYYFFSL